MKTATDELVIPRSPILIAYTDLDNAWKAAEADFSAMGVPVVVSYKVSDKDYLEWRRCKGRWRICWVGVLSDTEQDWKPVLECSVSLRVDLAFFLRFLQREMEITRNLLLPRVREAIEEINNIITKE